MAEMDYVLDTLLESLLNLIPCDSAQVLLAESADRLFLARERQSRRNVRQTQRPPMTWNAIDYDPLMQVLATRNALLVRDTADQAGWPKFKGHSHFRSWLGIPLIASQEVLGLLCLGDLKSHVFAQEHVRLAKSLAIPAAVAIQNARLYERAEIYGAELEKQLADLERTHHALEKAEENRAFSEERFSKVFRASPVAFSITTVDDGRFLDVNEAFERMYGYSRNELIGRTILEIGISGDSQDRSRVLAEIREHGSVSNHVTRIRKHSGEVVEAVFSAQVLELEGQRCILAVTEEVTDRPQLHASLASRTSSAS